MVATTAAGRVLRDDESLRLRERELAGVLRDYRSLPESDRKAALPDPLAAKPPERLVPRAPVNGLVARGYCTYLRRAPDGSIIRSKEFYYKENPNRWAAETQSDMFWLTESEWRSLLPPNSKPGDHVTVSDVIRNRFFCTIGIDYLEGSVDALAARRSDMMLTVERVTDDGIDLRLNGSAELGRAFDANLRRKPNSRGCEVGVLGFVHFNNRKNAIDRFDVVGVGRAWGSKMGYVDREIRVAEYPWMYGIAVELVAGDSPADRIPPYNMLHYGLKEPYLPESE